jgi:hypothetical protein
MKRILLVALAAAATLAGPATAKTVSYKNFESPSGKIRCLALKFGGKGIECSAPYIKEIGELDTYYGLEPHGKSKVGERGDFPGFSTPSRTLNYGDKWERNGIHCTMRKSGLTCRNLDDHGFHIAKGDLRRF